MNKQLLEGKDEAMQQLWQQFKSMCCTEDDEDNSKLEEEVDDY